jgi:hypothetical protein
LAVTAPTSLAVTARCCGNSSSSAAREWDEASLRSTTVRLGTAGSLIAVGAVIPGHEFVTTLVAISAPGIVLVTPVPATAAPHDTA